MNQIQESIIQERVAFALREGSIRKDRDSGDEP
jgi:hypothetical protein